jgi:ABC-type sugar transport system ATPase subunit
LEGKPIHPSTPFRAIENGLVLLSESRTDEGVFPELSVAQNLIIMSEKQVSTKTWLRKDLISKKVNALRDLLKIVTYNPYRQTLNELSGGNQQKVVLGRLLGANPRILILDEPTRGVDVGTKAEIHRLIGEFVSQGNGVIMVSSDIPEIVNICDRVLILYQGRQVGIFQRGQASEEAVLKCAMGLTS